MGKLGERHEADALIGILLEYRNLVAGLAAELAERLASSSDRRRLLKLAEAWVELANGTHDRGCHRLPHMHDQPCP
jgi:hypothetical protein